MLNNRVAYNVSEVAKLLGISVSKCYQLVKSGSIPHLHLDGRYIIPVSAFDKWLDNSVTGGFSK